MFLLGFCMDEHVINNGNVTLGSLQFLAHLLLVMLGRRLDPKRYLIETESTKGCDKCRQQAGIWIKLFLPESRIRVQLGQELWFTDLGQIWVEGMSLLEHSHWVSLDRHICEFSRQALEQQPCLHISRLVCQLLKHQGFPFSVALLWPSAWEVVLHVLVL